MTHTHTVHIHHRQKETNHTVQVPDDRYVLMSAETQGEVYQPEAVGLSPKLRDQGYALLCVCYPRSDLEVETQDEDEVYELQFGQHFGKGKVRRGLPLDEE
jgi:ferredoxin